LGSIQDALADQGTTSQKITGSRDFSQGLSDEFLSRAGAQ